MTHTPTPIQSPAKCLADGNIFLIFDIAYGEKGFSGSGGCLIAKAINQFQGDRIVRALNSHEDLLAACKKVLYTLEFSGHPSWDDDVKSLKQAIAKAEGL